MTFDEMVRKVAEKNKLTNEKTRGVIQDALKMLAAAALNGGAPRLAALGQLTTVAVRTSGRRPDGTQWSGPPRVRLALRTRRTHKISSAAPTA